MRFSELPQITGGQVLQAGPDHALTGLLTDSRKVAGTLGVAFFAIHGARQDGHAFLASLHAQGVRFFVVERRPGESLPDAWVVLVEHAVTALQHIVAHHRKGFDLPVIGITGSNGKTIVKEWLHQLLSPDHRIAKSPASYNSQTGVPLSVWQLRPYHTLGIFEAGISTVGEMINLAEIVRPSLGILTNIGPAHDEGFRNSDEKLREKLRLFVDCASLVYCFDHAPVREAIRENGLPGRGWGFSDDADLRIQRSGNGYTVTAAAASFDIVLPFTDPASVENAFHCIATMVLLGYAGSEIAARVRALRSVPMRLELKEGINGCQIIDDTYNSDLAGLDVSLDFLEHQRQKRKKRIILSDMLQTGMPGEAWVRRVVRRVPGGCLIVGIGPTLTRHRDLLPADANVFPSTDDFLRSFDFDSLHDELILVKGARVFAFERIVARLQRKVHGTVLEIDLGALVHNLNAFRAMIKPETRIMAMVKAFAYGSGSAQIASVLQYHNVHYLGVAYAEEGVDLRKHHITLPIMVMNPDEDTFSTLVDHDLEPEIYSLRLLDQLVAFLQGRPCRIHLKLDTGMHRLGFGEDQIEALLDRLAGQPHLSVASIFSHLASADEPRHDSFTQEQAAQFSGMAERITERLGYRPLMHLLNSSGIMRFPAWQFDMVRVGVGLYGIDPTVDNQTRDLRPVATLRTVISQIRELPRGETIGYGRAGRAAEPLRLATIAIGYADGFSRAFSNGVGSVLVRGRPAAVVGNVCMDMTMIDVSGMPAEEGDDVIIFGAAWPIAEVARRIHTIPYELLTNTSARVRRVFVAESL